MHRPGVSSILHRAAVRLLPAEALEVDVEGARELLGAAAQHHPACGCILEAELQTRRGGPAHHAVPVGRRKAMTCGELGDVQVAGARVRERLQPREALRRGSVR